MIPNLFGTGDQFCGRQFFLGGVELGNGFGFSRRSPPAVRPGSSLATDQYQSWLGGSGSPVLGLVPTRGANAETGQPGGLVPVHSPFSTSDLLIGINNGNTYCSLKMSTYRDDPRRMEKKCFINFLQPNLS